MSFVKRGNLPELLAPAGSLEHLKAAVSAGADPMRSIWAERNLVPEPTHRIFPEKI